MRPRPPSRLPLPVVVPALAAALALAACAGDGPEAPMGAAAPGAVAAAEGQGDAAAPARRLTVAVAGDVHFERRVAARLDDPDEPVLGPIGEVLAAADIAVVNLETAVTERGAPQPKTYTFRAPPTALDALARAGVDVVSLANNHAVDFGAAGLEDTLAAAADSPVAVVGLGEDAASAYAPAVLDVNGTRVAVLGASQVQDRTLQAWSAGEASPGIASADGPRLVEAVRAAAGEADVVVVYLHWGRERESCPTYAQGRLAAELADAGADVVVGTHAHQLQGAGWLGETFVAYGLGNFLWYSSNSATADRTGVLTVTVVDGVSTSADLAPADIDARGVPVPLEGEARAEAVAEFAALRDCTGLAATPGPGA